MYDPVAYFCREDEEQQYVRLVVRYRCDFIILALVHPPTPNPQPPHASDTCQGDGQQYVHYCQH